MELRMSKKECFCAHCWWCESKLNYDTPVAYVTKRFRNTRSHKIAERFMKTDCIGVIIFEEYKSMTEKKFLGNGD